MKKILITGGAGFIGSHVVRRFVKNYPQYHIFNLDALTYAGNLENITDIENEPNYTFVSARLLLDSLRMEALPKLKMKSDATFDEMTALYTSYFKAYISHGIAQVMLDTKMADYIKYLMIYLFKALIELKFIIKKYFLIRSHFRLIQRRKSGRKIFL